MDFEKFKEIASNQVDPRWSLESVKELYDACRGSEISTDDEVERVGIAYRLGLAKGSCAGLALGRGIIQGYSTGKIK